MPKLLFAFHNCDEQSGLFCRPLLSCRSSHQVVEGSTHFSLVANRASAQRKQADDEEQGTLF